MKHLLITCALLGSGLLSLSAYAQDRPSPDAAELRVVELFTSQGCSSCPSSNKLVTQWSEDDSVIALTYSVDYWDYLGWRDSFADPEFTARQRAYSKAIGHGRVYTPQIIINGAVDKPRFTKRDVQSASLTTDRPGITLSASGDINIKAFELSAPAQIRIISFTQGTQEVSVKRGENGGRTLSLTNVVTHISKPHDYSGSPMEITPPSGTAYAVIIQEQSYGPIIAAAQFTP